MSWKMLELSLAHFHLWVGGEGTFHASLNASDCKGEQWLLDAFPFASE